jgi:alkanesulfonate monooxygenase SsuD/methylene tetrahydromethanopterin reductase-like flavin-dependent oxidoreductase (luciferase family)
MTMTANGHPRRYGVYLPHFGPNVSGEALVEGARDAERFGFDSVWVRDHLVYRPHGQDSPDRTHVEPLTVLTMAGAVTKRIVLATGSLIPYRHPIQLAIQYSALSQFVGGERIILGLGTGNFEHEFTAIGLGGVDRAAMMQEQIEIVRKLWTGVPIDHHGTFYSFDDVDTLPTPRGRIPIWYCGNSAAAARRAVESECDGLLPARVTRSTLRQRIARLRRLSGEAGRAVPEAGVVILASPGRTLEDGLRHVNVEGLIEEQRDQLRKRKAVPPPSGSFDTLADLEGVIVAGTPEQIAEGVERYHEIGVDHFVFDLRFRYDDWSEALEQVGTGVLPLLRRAAAAA